MSPSKKEAAKKVSADGWTFHVPAAVFVFAVFMGIALFPYAGFVSGLLGQAYEGLVRQNDPFWNALRIFARNIKATLVIGAAGLIVPGMSLLLLAVNGFVVGYAIRLVADKGMPLLKIAGGVLPHAFLEVLALIITAELTLRFWLAVIRPRKLRRRDSAYAAAKKAALRYATVVLPLLFASAFVEAYVSAWFLGLN
ncbi:Stage II sporulation protein M [uncultured archaeon]|nr:Stage II sporulation protein M [uncultured archaeon]